MNSENNSQNFRDPRPWNQLLLTLATLAFTAWAGVVVWMGSSIMDQLGKIQDSVSTMDNELESFKLRQSERITRAETRVDQLRELHDLEPAEHDLP